MIALVAVEYKRMKLIFLDIDGVLNSANYMVKRKEAKRELFLKKDSEADKREYRIAMACEDIDTNAVTMLNGIVFATDARVVISSTWRKSFGLNILQEILTRCGFSDARRIIGVTPCLYFERNNEYGYHNSVVRGCEIKAWVEMNKGVIGHKVSKLPYVILDDDSDMLYWQRNNFIQCDPLVGLTEVDAINAINILNGGE